MSFNHVFMMMISCPYRLAGQGHGEKRGGPAKQPSRLQSYKLQVTRNLADCGSLVKSVNKLNKCTLEIFSKEGQ